MWNKIEFQIQVQQQKQTPRQQIKKGGLLKDHPTTTNNKGIYMKHKYQGNAWNLLWENLPSWGKFSNNTKGILILPGSLLLEKKYELTNRFQA